MNSDRTIEEQGVENVVLKIDDVHRTRSGSAVVKPSRFMAVTKVSGKNWKEKACVEAIKAELHQLLEELCAL